MILIIKILSLIVFKNLLETFGSKILDGLQPPVRSLVEFLKTGHRQLGFEILLKANVTKRSQYKTRFYYNKKGHGHKLRLLNPTRQMVVWTGPKMKDKKVELRPAENYYGEEEVFVRPIAKGWNGEIVNTSSVRIPITIKVNSKLCHEP